MRTKWWMVVLGVVGALGVGCGSSSSGGGGGGGNGSGAFAQNFVDVLCADVAPCCTEPGFSVSECKRTYDLLVGGSLDAANPANYSFDQTAADLCLEQTRAALASCSGASGEACQQVYTGKLAEGANCVSAIECAGDLSCDEGVCGGDIIEGGVAGDSCYWSCHRMGASGYACGGTGPTKDDTLPRCFAEDGLYCSSDGSCTELVPLDGQCTSDGQCVLGAHCDTGTCVPKQGAGGACTTDLGCQDGLYCKDQACVAELPAGSPCVQFEDECADGSCQDGVCEASSTGGDLGIGLLCGLGTP